MNLNIVKFLQDYPIEAVELNQLHFPIQGSAGVHRVLVMLGENIEEMMEDVADGEDSVRVYVEGKDTLEREARRLRGKFVSVAC